MKRKILGKNGCYSYLQKGLILRVKIIRERRVVGVITVMKAAQAS